MNITISKSVNERVLRTALTLQEIDQDQDQELQKQEAYYKALIADITQREIIEILFSDILDLYRNNNGIILDAVNTMESTLKSSFISNAKKEYPTMTVINKALSKSTEFRKAAWSLIGIQEDVDFPILPYNLMIYSLLSSTAHNLGIKKILFQSDLDPKVKAFYISLCEIYERNYEEIDAELVALAKKEKYIE